MIKKLLLILIVFLVDRITKIVVISSLKTKESVVVIKNFFSITLAKNTGVAFSLLDGKFLMIVITSIIVIMILLYGLKKNHDKKENLIYCLIIGGALGNLIDRLLYGYVIDFLDFKILGYHYPTFNLADTIIVIAMILLLFGKKTEGALEHEISSRKRKDKN